VFGRGPGTKLIDFGGSSDYDPDPGIVKESM